MKTIQSILFTDPQDQKEADRCPICGACRYMPTLHCIRCERDKP